MSTRRVSYPKTVEKAVADRVALRRFPRPARRIAQAFRRMQDPTPAISDVLDTLGVNGVVSSAALRPVLADGVIAGPAVTLRYAPERLTVTEGHRRGEKGKLGHMDAMALARRGDVLVIDGGGAEISIFGGLAARALLKAGLSGVVVDASCRDLEEIRSLGCPVWSRHTSPRSGRLRMEAVEINGVVDAGGVQVRPGDLIVADGNGIAVIPAGMAADVLKAVQELLRAETGTR
ncbi:MAG: RraA family protein [Chloroflexi bacterium]|nr:RraA family protein [Chloroflexota bacterium]